MLADAEALVEAAASAPGAHQLASPARRMNAGTSVPRMTKASSSTARVRPMPNSLMKLTSLVAKARNTTEIRSGGRGDDAAGALEADGDGGDVVARRGRAPP